MLSGNPNPAGQGQVITPGQVDFGALFQTALNIWKSNLTDLVLMTLVFCLVAWIPIANVGFIAGYTRSLLKVARGQGRAQIGDIFNSWDRFGVLLVYLIIYLVAAVVCSFVPIVGKLATIALGLVMVPGMYLVIDKGQDAIESYKWGIATIQADPVNWLLVYIVGSAIGFAGCIALGIGIILTLPLGQLIIIQQYERTR
jgi:hypothetical protein